MLKHLTLSLLALLVLTACDEKHSGKKSSTSDRATIKTDPPSTAGKADGATSDDKGDDRIPAKLLALQRECIGGSGSACARAGRDWARGEGLKRPQPGRARLYYNKGCEAGEQGACLELGLMMSRGEGGIRDPKRAQGYFEAACQANIAQGCLYLGSLLLASPKKAERESARAPLDKACSAKLQEGCALKARLLLDEGGIAKIREAHKLLRPACADSVGEACNSLGVSHRQGRGTFPVDLVQALSFFQRACAAKSAQGCFNLAQAYLHGQGTPKDLDDTRAYFEKACQLKLARSCSILAQAHLKGQWGLTRDVNRAKNLYNQACKLNYPQGCYNLATLLQQLGKDPNAQQAAKQAFRKACKLGQMSACPRAQ